MNIHANKIAGINKHNTFTCVLSIILLLLVYLTGFSSCSDKLDLNNNQKFTAYYVDSQNGDDTNDGHSVNSAWKSLSKINKVHFNEGDTIFFKRGSAFTGTIQINDSGNTEKYIVVTDYGDIQLPAPAFTNPEFNPEKNDFGNCIRLKGSYIIVENLYFHNTVAELPSTAGSFTTMWELGAVYVDKTAQNCIIRNNEIYDCGVGIKSYGQHTVISNNFIHDCNRVLKEWSWGPIGVWLGGDYQEVCFNRIFNYSAVDPRISWGPNSYGGGADGGAIEIDDARNPKSNISIHHNYTRDCQGFLEVTWSDVQQNPLYENFEIHHNVSDDYQQFVALWRGANCRIENNTIIRRKRNANDWGVFNITQNNAKNLIRNNIVVVENEIVIFNVGKNGTAKPASVISNNLYYAATGTLNIGKEGPGQDAVIEDPQFVNYGGEKATDFLINSTSPACNKGLNLGYKEDFILIPIPQNNNADIGAFEYKPE